MKVAGEMERGGGDRQGSKSNCCGRPPEDSLLVPPSRYTFSSSLFFRQAALGLRLRSVRRGKVEGKGTLMTLP